MNTAILIGNLTKTPELRATQSGISTCSFTIAVQRRVPNKNGERQTDFINVVTWRGLADLCVKYLQKGSKAAVVGEIQTRTYEAQNGTKRYVTEIVANEVEFLSKAKQAEIPGFTEIDEDVPF